MTATLSLPVAPSRTTSFTPPIATAADALRARGFGVVIAHSADDARRAVLDLLPDGAAVNTGASATLTALGITDAIQDARRLTAVRPLVATMDRATQADEIRRMLAAPDVMLASAAAVTQDGRVLLASGSGSQIGPIASGAGRVVLVIGAQKVVPDLDAAFERLHGDGLSARERTRPRGLRHRRIDQPDPRPARRRSRPHHGRAGNRVRRLLGWTADRGAHRHAGHHRRRHQHPAAHRGA